jgi:hypothetical protein
MSGASGGVSGGGERKPKPDARGGVDSKSTTSAGREVDALGVPMPAYRVRGKRRCSQGCEGRGCGSGHWCGSFHPSRRMGPVTVLSMCLYGGPRAAITRATAIQGRGGRVHNNEQDEGHPRVLRGDGVSARACQTEPECAAYIPRRAPRPLWTTHSQNFVLLKRFCRSR